MGERIVPTDPQEIDGGFLARLFLGALSEHEQRLVVVRLLSRDAVLRAAVAAVVEPFEVYDLDSVSEFARVLREAGPDPGAGRDVEEVRRRILERAEGRADFEQMLREFTFSDVLELGEVTRKLFSWTMAEKLLDRTRRVGLCDQEAATSLYLATMVVDVVEILGEAGHAPQYPEVIRDVRRRISEASKSLGR